MAIALSLLSKMESRNKITRVVALTFSGNYATGGDALPLNAISDPNNLGAAGAFTQVDTILATSDPAGYGPEIVAGSGVSGWKLKLFSAAGTELAAGAYPAALTGDANGTLAIVSPTNV